MNLVVGDYLEVAGRFDGVCLIKESFKGITSRFPHVVKTVQQYHASYGERVFDLGEVQENLNVIYTPLHNMQKVKDTCEQLRALAVKQGFKKVLVPMPGNFHEIKSILEEVLDDRFTLITDDPTYIQSIEKTEDSGRKILECSTKGDKRFSALYAQVEYMNVYNSIENHYQSCKRFLSEDGGYIPHSNPKGKRVDATEVFDELYDAHMLTPFYKWLWLRYFDANPDLLEYAREFDDYNDAFKGKSVNCQADVIRDIVHDMEGTRSSVSFVQDMANTYYEKNSFTGNELLEKENDDLIIEVNNEPTLIVTGHRPKDLWYYNNCAEYHKLQNMIYKCILQFASNHDVKRFVNGGAQGVDQLFFWAVEHARKLDPGIKNEVFIPYAHQDSVWKEEGMFSRSEWRTMVSQATHVKNCFPIYDENTDSRLLIKGLTDRNTMMVREATYVLGVYKGDINLITTDGPPKGGTLNCLRQAYRAKKKIVVLNPMTLETTRINF